MGARGPKPTNPALKILAGNPGKRPVVLASGSTQPAPLPMGAPARPPELTGVAADEWNRLAALLDGAGLIAQTDTGILAAYCLAFSDMLACRAAVAECGRFASQPIQNATGAVIGTRYVEHPAVGRLAESSRRVATLAEALGITAAARARREGEATHAAPAAESNRIVDIRERIRANRIGS